MCRDYYSLTHRVFYWNRFRVDGAPTLLYFARKNSSSAQEVLVRKAEAIASQINRLANESLFDLVDEELETEAAKLLEAADLQLKYVENISLDEIDSILAKRKTHFLVLFVTNGSEPEFEQNNHLAAFDVVCIVCHCIFMELFIAAGCRNSQGNSCRNPRYDGYSNGFCKCSRCRSVERFGKKVGFLN